MRRAFDMWSAFRGSGGVDRDSGGRGGTGECDVGRGERQFEAESEFQIRGVEEGDSTFTSEIVSVAPGACAGFVVDDDPVIAEPAVEPLGFLFGYEMTALGS